MAKSTLNVVRGWSDPEYRASLNAAESARLPSRPPSLIELTDERLDQRGTFDPMMMPPPEIETETDYGLPYEECYDDLAGWSLFEDDPMDYADSEEEFPDGAFAGY
jgi:mersacidin/lichenicidin family type 2 lantibiotic